MERELSEQEKRWIEDHIQTDEFWERFHEEKETRLDLEPVDLALEDLDDWYSSEDEDEEDDETED